MTNTTKRPTKPKAVPSIKRKTATKKQVEAITNQAFEQYRTALENLAKR